MSTPAQIAANRSNAQHSTGPTSEAGRASSSQNHFKHGFTGEFRLLHNEDPAAYQAVHAALETVWELVREANALVERKAPWKLAKDRGRAAELDAVLYALAETCRLLAALVSPVIPGASRKILAQLQAETIEDLAWGTLADQHRLGEPSPVFPRIELPAE